MKVFRDKSHFICFGYFAATLTDPNLRLIYSANEHFVNALLKRRNSWTPTKIHRKAEYNNRFLFHW